MDFSQGQKVMKQPRQLIGGILLVSGTTIGAGMLALPVSTGLAGFFPTVFLLCFYWFYMTYTAFLMLEANLWMKPHTNLISMAKRTLGRPGEIVSWVTYLFLLYSLTTAYIAGSGPIFIDVVETLTGYAMPEYLGPIPLLLIFGSFIYKGTKHVDYANRILMIGLVVAFALLIVFLVPHVKPKLLFHADPRYSLLAISIIATSFGFHIIIPSLRSYFNDNLSLLKKSIVIGSFIPLVVYIIWELLTLGIIPVNVLAQGYAEGTNGANILSDVLGHSSIAMIARFFSFFAIVTSFLGVSLSLFDFLADGLQIEKTRGGRLCLYALTFLPPLMITFYDPRAFLTALEYAGAFGVITLLGLLPALMVWQGRYVKHYPSTFKVKGGKLALIATIFVSLFVIGLEIFNKLGLNKINLVAE